MKGILKSEKQQKKTKQESKRTWVSAEIDVWVEKVQPRDAVRRKARHPFGLHASHVDGMSGVPLVIEAASLCTNHSTDGRPEFAVKGGTEAGSCRETCWASSAVCSLCAFATARRDTVCRLSACRKERESPRQMSSTRPLLETYLLET